MLALLIIGALAVVVLLGTHTQVGVGGPSVYSPTLAPGTQTGGPLATAQAQALANAQTRAGTSTVAQNVLAGSGNQIAQDISAGAGLLTAAAKVFQGWNPGGGSTSVSPPSPTGVSSPNDLNSGTQSSNNFDPALAGPVSLNDPSTTPLNVDYTNFTWGGQDTGGVASG